jgi:pimeloyl-ACP methyl ester carboxylesterase
MGDLLCRSIVVYSDRRFADNSSVRSTDDFAHLDKKTSLPTEQAASVKAPTLVIAGGADFPWMRETAQALAEAIPDGQRRILEGQGHDVDPADLAGALVEFFT